MTQQQFIQTVAAEQEWQYEAEEKRIERANEILAEMSESRDEEFRREIEAKYPILKGWAK